MVELNFSAQPSDESGIEEARDFLDGTLEATSLNSRATRHWFDNQPEWARAVIKILNSLTYAPPSMIHGDIGTMFGRDPERGWWVGVVTGVRDYGTKP